MVLNFSSLACTPGRESPPQGGRSPPDASFYSLFVVHVCLDWVTEACQTRATPTQPMGTDPSGMEYLPRGGPDAGELIFPTSFYSCQA